MAEIQMREQSQVLTRTVNGGSHQWCERGRVGLLGDGRVGLRGGYTLYFVFQFQV